MSHQGSPGGLGNSSQLGNCKNSIPRLDPRLNSFAVLEVIKSIFLIIIKAPRWFPIDNKAETLDSGFAVQKCGFHEPAASPESLLETSIQDSTLDLLNCCLYISISSWLPCVIKTDKTFRQWLILSVPVNLCLGLPAIKKEIWVLRSFGKTAYQYSIKLSIKINESLFLCLKYL